MTVSICRSSVVAQTNTSIKLSSLINVTADQANPTYLVIVGLDRIAYPAGSTGATGALVGNHQSDRFTDYFSNDYSNNAVFIYNKNTGRYFSKQYGYLDQMVYQTSSGANDFTQLDVFATNNPHAAYDWINDPYAMILTGWAFGEVGSIGIANQANAAPAPVQATPLQLAAVAKSFVGRQWNVNGCWTLAQTIATEAGASLPAATAYDGLIAQPYGQWITVFDSHRGQRGDWQSMVTAGDVVVFGNPNTGLGHITTCVSGSGAGALLVDNIALYNQSGNLVNPSTDGSSSDITIAGPVPVSLEWPQADPSDVSIYRLDTPIIANKGSAPPKVMEGTKLALSNLFSATDSAKQAITAVEFYDSLGSDQFQVHNGPLHSYHDSAHYGAADTFAGVSLLTGAKAGTDTITVRAENALGSWGDWQSLTVNVGTTARSAGATLLNNQYDSLVQGMAGLYGVLGGGEPSLQNLPQSDWPQLAPSLYHG